MKNARPLEALLTALVLSTAVACDDGDPTSPSAWHLQVDEVELPTQLDFLFVVDDGPTMCEEQENLTRNFGAFSNVLFEELGASSRYRIAVVGMGLDGPTPGGFSVEPAPAEPDPRCVGDAGEFNIPNTQDCAALIAEGLDPIIASGADGNIGRACDAADPTAQAQCAQEDLERRFRCLATLGTAREGASQGLEAMRLALDCNGPNAHHFDPCCVDAPDGGRVYDPECATSPDATPDFLRPEAVLVVVLISDRDDCSSPASNPRYTRRAICRHGARDADGDGYPDGFADPALCPGDPAGCYRDECGALSPAACAAGCRVGPDAETCAAQADRLTPVVDYRRFLEGLKRDPDEQLMVLSVVGRPDYTPAGHAIHWTDASPVDGCSPGEISDACCPEGRCSGPLQPGCASENGQAFTGHRYHALTDPLGRDGLGCRQPPAGLDDDDARVRACVDGGTHAACQYLGDRGGVIGGQCLPMPEDGRLACAECVTICEDDFAGPLGRVREKVAEQAAAFCLDVAPPCRVSGGDEAATARACVTPDERASPRNYPIRVRLSCPAEHDFYCGAVDGLVLGSTDWALHLDQAGCAGGAVLRLRQPVPGGTRVHIEYPLYTDG